MSMVKKKYYQAAKVKRITAGLEEIPEDCGYEKKFRFNIDMNSNGIMGECIDWCQRNCKGRWGWWFENKNMYDEKWHNWEDQNAYMSFERKVDATMFWLSIGAECMGRNDGAYMK